MLTSPSLFQGLWDKGNIWLGPFLNAHTNLTEITQYLDLFWRNTIAPNKVNLGLAFYSRTFVASSRSCMEPACTFDAVGDPGPCTNSLGTLSNAELTDKIKAAGVTPTLNKEAAVEIATVGNWWIAYDDQASWELKLDFARSECLGGVMVWAVSEDYNDGTYSKQLQAATGYNSPAVLNEKSTSGNGSTGMVYSLFSLSFFLSFPFSSPSPFPSSLLFPAWSFLSPP